MNPIISPETVAQHLVEVEFNELGWWSELEQMPHDLQKLCADRGDREGLSFWVSVYGQYLVFDSHFEQTRCFPCIENDDPIEYLAMMFWERGWGTLDMALWSANQHQHPAAIEFLDRMFGRFVRLDQERA